MQGRCYKFDIPSDEVLQLGDGIAGRPIGGPRLKELLKFIEKTGRY